MPTISVVIPVYRGEKTLRALYAQLIELLPKITPAFEILFVEDGCYDGSWAIISALAAGDARVRGLRMSRNYGQHNALLCGMPRR